MAYDGIKHATRSSIFDILEAYKRQQNLTLSFLHMAPDLLWEPRHLGFTPRARPHIPMGRRELGVAALQRAARILVQ